MSEKRALESIYLQTNKEVFELDEGIWFSATILNNQTLLPSDASTILYVLLVDLATDDVISEESYAITNGFAEGHLPIPSTYAPGEYHLYAFTVNSFGPIQKSVKKILIKDRLIPKILVSIEFDQEAYRVGDEISVTLKANLRTGEAIEKAKVDFKLVSNESRLQRYKTETDSAGTANYTFEYPAFNDLILEVELRKEKQSEFLQVEIPYNRAENIQLTFLPEGGNLVTEMSNYLAFKAVDKAGKPFSIQKGEIINQQGKVVKAFSSQYNGMGKFMFRPQPSETYSARIVEPFVDSVFQLPKIHNEGYGLSLMSETDDVFKFAIKKLSKMPNDSLNLLVYQRGKLKWMGTMNVVGDGVFVEVPKGLFDTGIAVARLVENDFTPIAERLIFCHAQKVLNFEITTDRKNYTTKEKAALTLKVTDENGKPVQASLGISIVDEAFKSVYQASDITSYFYLTNEVKGMIHNPTSYFDVDNPNRFEQLDLLLMTQGWRAYEWGAIEAFDLEETPKLSEDVVAHVDMQRVPKRFRPGEKFDNQFVASMIGPFGMSEALITHSGQFVVPAGHILNSAGAEVYFTVQAAKEAPINTYSVFNEIEKFRSDKLDFYTSYRLPQKHRNWNKLPQVLADTRRLDDVEVTDYQTYIPKYGRRDDGTYRGKLSDYICVEYGILNCRNHTTGGYKPMNGRYYKFGLGYVLYYAEGQGPEKDSNVNYIKGVYKPPKFYQPNYDENPEERLISDFRNTLLWESSLFTDENGEVTLDFWTSDIQSVFEGHIDALGINGYLGAANFKVKVLR